MNRRLRLAVKGLLAVCVLVSTMGVASNCPALGPEGTQHPEKGVVPENKPKPLPQRAKPKKDEYLYFEAVWNRPEDRRKGDITVIYTYNGKPHTVHPIMGINTDGTRISRWSSEPIKDWSPPVWMETSQKQTEVGFQISCAIYKGNQNVAGKASDLHYKTRKVFCDTLFAGEIDKGGA